VERAKNTDKNPLKKVIFWFCGKVIAEPKEQEMKVSVVVDIQTVSIAIASASVVAGVVYYAFQVRHQTKMRQTDLVIRLSTYVVRRDFLEAIVDILNTEFEDYGDFVRKYGKPFSKKQIPMSFLMVGNFSEQLGVLFRNKLIDISLISQLFTIPELWEKMRLIVEGIRKEEHNQGYYEWFEYLFNEMKKREQKLQQSSVKGE
jgi:hypothetical protein